LGRGIRSEKTGDHKSLKSWIVDMRVKRYQKKTGDHKGPPSRTPPPSPLRAEEEVFKRIDTKELPKMCCMIWRLCKYALIAGVQKS
jgi:hypothetical protein